MNSIRPFTDKFLQSLKPALGRYDVRDPGRRGLTVRVFPSGTKAFVVRYRRHGQLLRLTMGNYPAMPLREAYEKHAELVRRLHRGEELKGALAGATAPKSALVTVGDLADEFLRRYIYIERKQPRDAELIIQANIVAPAGPRDQPSGCRAAA